MKKKKTQFRKNKKRKKKSKPRLKKNRKKSKWMEENLTCLEMYCKNLKAI